MMNRFIIAIGTVFLTVSCVWARSQDVNMPNSIPVGALSPYDGPVSTTGTQANGADKINHISVNGIVNPATYGVKCDGTTNDAPAIQNALNAAQVTVNANALSTIVVATQGVRCIVNSQINIPYFVSFDSSGSVLDFSGLPANGTAINLGNPGPVTPRYEGRWVVKLGVVVGPGAGTASTGVLLGGASSTTGQFAAAAWDGGTIQTFGTAMKLGNNAFEFTVQNVHVLQCGRGYEELASLSNCGENVLFLHDMWDHFTVGPTMNLGGGCPGEDVTLLANSFDDSCEPYLKLQGGVRLSSAFNHFENDGDLPCSIVGAGAAAYYDIIGQYESMTIDSDTFNELPGSAGTPSGIPIAWDNSGAYQAGMLVISNPDWHSASTRNILDATTGNTNANGTPRTSFIAGRSTAGCGHIGTYFYNSALTNCIDNQDNQVSFSGSSTSGTVIGRWTQRSFGEKRLVLNLSRYVETGAAQTYTYYPPFQGTPTVTESSGTGSTTGGSAGSCGTYHCSSTSTTLTLPANATMTAESCTCVIDGQ